MFRRGSRAILRAAGRAEQHDVTGVSGCGIYRGFSSADFPFNPPGRNHLFVPGPVNIHERVLRAMSIPGQNHRDPWFAPFFKQCLKDCKWLFRSEKGTPFIFPGTGTGAWEAALTNTLSPGDKVLSFRYGVFSHLWIDMMQRFGLDVKVIECRWGDGANEEKMLECLKNDKEHKIKAVCVVQNETTTGVFSDVKKVREYLDSINHPALLMVDGVSSIGALDFKFDEWRVDVAVTGSQKALSIPTGLGLVCASEKALEAMKTSHLKNCYFDFTDMLKTNPQGSVPYTPSLPLLYGMRESVNLLREEGWDNVVARHKRLAEGCRAAVKAWGLDLLCKNPRWYSDALTVVEVPKDVDSNDIVKNAYAKYNLSIGLGLAKVNGKVFRIGHLGNMDEVMLLGALSGVEMAMMDAGVKFTPGSGVGAAVEHFQKTSRVCWSTRSL